MKRIEPKTVLILSLTLPIRQQRLLYQKKIIKLAAFVLLIWFSETALFTVRRKRNKYKADRWNPKRKKRKIISNVHNSLFQKKSWPTTYMSSIHKINGVFYELVEVNQISSVNTSQRRSLNYKGVGGFLTHTLPRCRERSNLRLLFYKSRLFLTPLFKTTAGLSLC